MQICIFAYHLILVIGLKMSYTKEEVKILLKNKKDIIQLEQTLGQMKREISSMTEGEFLNKIRENWEILKNKARNEVLEAMHIDTLSTIESGLPINRLVAAGFLSIADLKDLTVKHLVTIDGIGAVFAEMIHESIKKITKSVQNEVRPKLNVDQLQAEELALLKSIYAKWKVIEEKERFLAKLNTYTRRTKEDRTIAKNKKGIVRSLFQNNRLKNDIELAYKRLNDSQFEVLEKEFERARHFIISDEEITEHFIENNIQYYIELENIIGIDPSEAPEDLPLEIVEEINNRQLHKTGLHVELRHYQAFGAKFALHFKRTLLGDEMGLGKTMQAMAVINHLKQEGQSYAVVVCPLSILSNWKRELGTHSTLNIFVFHGDQRDSELSGWKKETGVLLTTYEHTRHLQLDDGLLNVLIVDEAHYVKNPAAKRSQNVYRLTEQAEYVLFMSGTPLENRLEEMKQLITVLQPEIGRVLSKDLYLLEPTNFKRTVSEVYLRRNRQDVLKELPDLEMIEQWMPFGEKEREIYINAVKDGQLMLMRRAAWLGESPQQSPKLKKLFDICEEAKENGHKVLVFSFFRDVLRIIHTQLGNQPYETISGDVSNQRRQEIIDEFTAAEPGAVLLSQITAGGVGLNIQAANIVILCEPQWKPSIEHQAISRAYRMGQSRNVLVYRLLTEQSIDGIMLETLGHKSYVFDLYAKDSDIGNLSLNKYHEKEDGNLQQKLIDMERMRLEEEGA